MKNKLVIAFILSFVAFMLGSCSSDEDDETTPTVELAVLSATTLTSYDAPTANSSGSVTASATVTFAEGSEPTSTGFVVSFASGGTLGNTSGGGSVSAGSLTNGSFQGDILLTEVNTLYYIRAYATNAAGTSHGPEIELDTSN